MANSWDIKISEGKLGNTSGYYVSVENKFGKKISVKGLIQGIDKALQAGKDMIVQHVSEHKAKIKKAERIKDMLAKEYVLSNMFQGIYGIGTQYEGNDVSNEPYINVLMDTGNDKLMQIIPDSVAGVKVVKEFSTPIVAQSKRR